MKRKRIIVCIACVVAAAIVIALIINRLTSMFPNKGLEVVIRAQINKPYGIITPEDCKGITELDLSLCNLNLSLEGIQYFVDLEKLESSAGILTDISALSGLTKLKELNLYLNNVNDITPLSGLTNLEYLDLSRNNVKDLSPLASLTNLKHLIIGQNPAGYVDYIMDGTNIVGYDIPDSFTPLAHLEGLQIGAWADYNLTVIDGSFVDTNSLPDEKVYGDPPEVVESEIIP